MDKYLWERIQIFLSRDDLLCLRETSKFHAACEWYGPGWTVILSPLVHIVRRPSWDLPKEFVRYMWFLDSDSSEAFQIERVSFLDQIVTRLQLHPTSTEIQIHLLSSETLALWLRVPEVLWQRPNVTNLDADNLKASSQREYCNPLVWTETQSRTSQRRSMKQK